MQALLLVQLEQETVLAGEQGGAALLQFVLQLGPGAMREMLQEAVELLQAAQAVAEQ